MPTPPLPMKHMRHFMAEMDFAEDEFEFYGKFTGIDSMSLNPDSLPGVARRLAQ
jgi:hypothetical protein